MPAKKHQRANEGRLQKRAATEKVPLKRAAAKASRELVITMKEKLRS
jgi:hypothetical protein